MQGPRSEGKRLWDRDKQCYKVNLLSHHILECGNRLVPELVSGQVQGGAAMGIGHVLCEYRRFTRMGPTTAPGTSIAIICHSPAT